MLNLGGKGRTSTKYEKKADQPEAGIKDDRRLRKIKRNGRPDYVKNRKSPLLRKGKEKEKDRRGIRATEAGKPTA